MKTKENSSDARLIRAHWNPLTVSQNTTGWVQLRGKSSDKGTCVIKGTIVIMLL